MLEIGTIFLVGACAVLVWLTGFVLVRKRLRDRSERRSRLRRTRYLSVLTSGGDDELHTLVARAAKRRRSAAARDLVLMLEQVEWTPALAARLDAAIGRSDVTFRLERALRARDPVERGIAALLITRLRLRHAGSVVAPLLKDPDPDVRLAACGGLAFVATPAAARALIYALVDSQLTDERVVERLGAPWAASELHAALAHDVRRLQAGGAARSAASLARALGLARATAAAATLVELLRLGDEEARISAARALATCGGPAAVPALEDALHDDAWTVRVQAARALGALGVERAAPRLAELLADEAWWVRAAAADALRELGPVGHAKLHLAREHPDRYARERALEALALIEREDERAVPAS